MTKPTRRTLLTAGCLTITGALIVVGMSALPASTRTATDLAAANVGVTTADSSSPHGTLSAPAPSSSAAASPSASPSNVTVVLPPAPGSRPLVQDAAAVAAAAAAAANTPAAPKPRTTVTKKPTTSGGGGGAAPAPAGGGSSYPQHADIANAIFNSINSSRASNGLAALARSSQLNNAANAHNVAMANTGQFAHQVSGEASLGARISAAGASWSWAAENIAWGSYASVAFGLSLQAQMYNETPPNDGHRRNMLSTSARKVGVDVITDASGKMWITCDFSS